MGVAEAYRGSWSQRASLIGDRLIANSFPLPRRVSVRRFTKLFPDQNEYLTRWAKHLKVRSTQKLMTKPGYKDGPELFSMFACLLQDPRLRAMPVRSFKKRGVRRAIAKAKRESKNRFGHVGHPAVICARALEGA